MADMSTVASPEVTAGSGQSYEQDVAALYLVDLLTGVGVRGLTSALGVTIQLQRRALGAPLDDLVVTARAPDGRAAQLHLQIKRKLTLSDAPSNEDFREIVHAAWDSIQDAGFARGLSRVGGGTEYVAFERLRASRALHHAAQTSHNGREFRSRLEVHGLFDKSTRGLDSDVRTLLQQRLSRPPTEDESWTFWRHFVVLQFELTDDGALDAHNAIQSLRLAFPAEAERALDIFDALRRVTSVVGTSAGSLDRNALVDLLGGRFSLQRLELRAGDSLEASTTSARAGSLEDVRAFMAERPQALFYSLGVQVLAENKRNSIERDELVRFLRRGDDVVLEAGPGAGKSTALFQLAESVHHSCINLVPVIVPLAEWAVGGRALLDELAHRAAFVEVGVTRLRRLAHAGRLVMLLDGWNELSNEQRQSIRAMMGSFRRDYPANPVLLATRAEAIALPVLSLAPRKQHRVALLSLEPVQSLALLSSFLERDATEFFAAAARIPGMDSVLRMPLYVQALALTLRRGGLPTTKEALVGELARVHDERPNQGLALNEVTMGQHQYILRHLAVFMTNSGVTAARADQIRREIMVAGEALLRNGQIGLPLEPMNVMNGLVAHHHLVAGDGQFDLRPIAFQHQQFQEWYASLEVEAQFRAASADDSAAVLLRDRMLDDQVWEQAVLFAAERLAHREDGDVHAVTSAIIRAAGIDSLFAATLVQHGSDAIWNMVRARLTAFVHALLDSGRRPDALAFVLASGRPEYADIAWSLLSDTGLYRDVVLNQGCLQANSLGQDLASRLQEWPIDRQTQFAWDLVHTGSPEGIDLAIAYVLGRDHVQMMVSLLDVLDFRGQFARVDVLLGSASDAVWKTLVERNIELSLGPELALRFSEVRKAFALALPRGRWRVNLLVGLEFTGTPALPPEVVAQELAETFGSETYDASVRFAGLHASLFSNALIDRMLRQEHFPDSAATFVLPAKTELQPRILACALAASSDSVRTAAVRAMNSETVLLLLYRHLENITRGAPRATQNAIRDALLASRDEDLLSAVVDATIEGVEAIAAVADVVSRWKAPFVVPSEIKDRLCERFGDWGLTLLNERAPTYCLSDLAGAMGRVCDSRLISSAFELLDRELQSLEQARSERRLRPRWPMIIVASNVLLYRRAFESFPVELLEKRLLGLLASVDFGEQAASLLVPIGGRDRPSGGGFGQGLTRAAFRIAQNSARRHVATNRAASAVLDCIQSCSESAEGHSLLLSIQAAQMECGDRITELFGIAAAGDAERRYRLLRTLLEVGILPPAAPVESGLRTSLATALRENWSEQNWWRVDGWFELAAFILPLSAIQAAVRELVAVEQRPDRRLRSLVSALGMSGTAESLNVLRWLLEEVNVECEYWIEAVANIGSEDAALLLVEVMFQEGRSEAVAGQSLLNSKVGVAIGRHALARESLLRRLHGPIVASSRAAVGSVIANAHSIDLILGALPFASTDRTDRVTQGIARAIDKLSFVQRPVDGNPNISSVEPVDLSFLRTKLFAFSQSEGSTATVAIWMLEAIEAARNLYGRALGERRHPDISLGAPWPPEAAVVWSGK